MPHARLHMHSPSDGDQVNPGDRVVVLPDSTYGEPMTGHYGKVCHTARAIDERGPIVLVHLTGRTDGATVHPQLLGVTWPFYPDELEHAD